MPPSRTPHRHGYNYAASFRRFTPAAPRKDPDPKDNPDSKEDADSKAKKPAPPAYDPWVRCLEAPREHPDWENREWFLREGFNYKDSGDRKRVTRYAQAEAQRVQEKYGGRWCGVVRVADNTPCEPRLTQAQLDALYEHILNGPDSVGRQWLSKRKKGDPLCVLDVLSR